jgi:hypothetical protein
MVALLGSAGEALAQESREAEITAAEAAKATQLTPYVPDQA